MTTINQKVSLFAKIMQWDLSVDHDLHSRFSLPAEWRGGGGD